MFSSRLNVLIVLAAFLFGLGCSGANSPSAPLLQEQRDVEYTSSHHTWGLWQFTGDPELGTLDAVQLRQGDMHLNALHFLEPPPMVYLTIENLQFNGNLLDVDIGLRHPFLGLTQYTGFDVCGIFISTGSVSGFSDPDLVIPGPGDIRLVNPDGFTRWWNPVEFPVNPGTMFGYIDGAMGTPESAGLFNATLNPYKYFCDDLGPIDTLSHIIPDNRGMFSPGQKNIRHYTIEKTAGALIFNYAVDACWKFPSGGSPWTAPDDFGPGANRPEAYRISVTEISNTLWNDGAGNGGGLSLEIDVYDWFNPELNKVMVESPGNFGAVISDTPISGGSDEYSTFEVEITGATPAEDSIDLLITVGSEVDGYGGLLPGKPISTYVSLRVDVSDNPPSMDGLVALADADYYELPPGMTVQFNGSNSYDGDGYAIVDYVWDFGDTSPAEQGEFVSHQYPDAGLYDVTLTVENSNGAFDDDTIGILVCDCSDKVGRHTGIEWTGHDLDPSNEDTRKRQSDHMYANDYWIMQSADKIVGFDMSQSGDLSPVITLYTGVTGTVYSVDCGLDDRVAWASDSDKTLIRIVDSVGNPVTEINSPDGEEFWAADFDYQDDLWVVTEDAGGTFIAHQYIKGDDDSYEIDDLWTHELPEIVAATMVFDIQVAHSTESMYIVSDPVLPGDSYHPDWPKARVDEYDRFGDHIRNAVVYGWSIYQTPFPYADIELDSSIRELEACRMNYYMQYQQPGIPPDHPPYDCNNYHRLTLLLDKIGPQFDIGGPRFQTTDLSNVTKRLETIDFEGDDYHWYTDTPTDW